MGGNSLGKGKGGGKYNAFQAGNFKKKTVVNNWDLTQSAQVNNLGNNFIFLREGMLDNANKKKSARDLGGTVKKGKAKTKTVVQGKDAFSERSKQAKSPKIKLVDILNHEFASTDPGDSGIATIIQDRTTLTGPEPKPIKPPASILAASPKFSFPNEYFQTTTPKNHPKEYFPEKPNKSSTTHPAPKTQKKPTKNTNNLKIHINSKDITPPLTPYSPSQNHFNSITLLPNIPTPSGSDITHNFTINGIMPPILIEEQSSPRGTHNPHSTSNLNLKSPTSLHKITPDYNQSKKIEYQSLNLKSIESIDINETNGIIRAAKELNSTIENKITSPRSTVGEGGMG